ncbi:MAG TPA: ABC transporter substrate-binding protein [Candidatus Avacidaminococcus intestinavium]|uniref:ABC transporter substrate-binding protein n=1 Tax=Candidatus Avacidaminococcus intestinavium TaxID=2840684 RepID=A0A9D1MPB0_9FIRM|nr:ABC transporter substrate-binding protein [Candidatus Avacidaminococcus intestinavium]
MIRQNMKKIVLGLSLLVGAGLLSGCGGEKKAEDGATKEMLKVGIVQLVEHESLDAANKGFVDGMAAKGFKENVNVIYDRQNAQADQSNLQNIAQRFVSTKMDLICAIATPAAQTMANATKEIPIVGTAITDYEAAKLVASSLEPKGNITGTTDMNPLQEQVELILKIVPTTKAIGVIYTSSEVNSQLQVDILKKILQEKNIEVIEATVSTVNDIQQAAQSLVGKVDAIYAPTDNIIASAMPNLASIAEPAKIPVFCGAGAMVKAGGVATVGIDYYKLGVQTGEMAARILAGEAQPATMPIEAQKEMQTIINLETIKRLGISIPEDILKAAK